MNSKSLKNNIMITKFILLSILVLNFSSCSYTQRLFNKNKNLESNSVNNVADSQESDNLFTLKILEKINDGEKIYILSEATCNEKFPTASVKVKLKLLSNSGEIVDEFLYNFAELVGKDKSNTFEKKVPKKFLITINANSSYSYIPTDFQLELSWEQNDEASASSIMAQANSLQTDINSDALTDLNATNNTSNTNNMYSVVNTSSVYPNEKNVGGQALKMKNLSFEKKMVSLNDKTPSYYFVISGEFENLSNKVINEISLAVSFKSKLSDNKLNNEPEFLEIKELTINPNDSKKFELELETILDSQDANIYKPDIKIVSFS